MTCVATARPEARPEARPAAPALPPAVELYTGRYGRAPADVLTFAALGRVLIALGDEINAAHVEGECECEWCRSGQDAGRENALDDVDGVRWVLSGTLERVSREGFVALVDQLKKGSAQ